MESMLRDMFVSCLVLFFALFFCAGILLMTRDGFRRKRQREELESGIVDNDASRHLFQFSGSGYADASGVTLRLAPTSETSAATMRWNEPLAPARVMQYFFRPQDYGVRFASATPKIMPTSVKGVRVVHWICDCGRKNRPELVDAMGTMRYYCAACGLCVECWRRRVLAPFMVSVDEKGHVHG